MATTAKIVVDEGTTTNTATYSFTEDAVTKHISRSVLSNNAGADTGVAALPLQVSLANTAGNSTAVKVDGSAVTQPVSAASLPLPTGAATVAKQPALGTAGSAATDVITIQGIASMTKLLVTPDLPSGASTAAKQPALGTAGSASTDVITIQGIASMTKLLVTPDLPALAATSTKQSDGSQKTQIVDGSGNVIGATSNALDINIKSGNLTTLPVTNAGTFAVQATVAAGATNIAKAEDVASADGDVGVPAMAIRKATPANTSGTDGDYEMIQMSAGRLWVDASGKTLTVDGSGATQPVSGTVTAISGTAANMKVEATIAAAQTLATITTVGTVTNLAQMNGAAILMGVGATGTGAQRVVLANDQGKTIVSTGGSASSSGNNTLVAAGTNKLKVYAFSLSTVSATAVTCIFQSGASGTELWRVILQTPASVAGGANLVVSPPAYIFATASATLLNLNLSAAVAVHWSVSYFDEA